MANVLGELLLMKIHGKQPIDCHGFSNMASDWLAAHCQPIRSNVRKFMGRTQGLSTKRLLTINLHKITLL